MGEVLSEEIQINIVSIDLINFQFTNHLKESQDDVKTINKERSANVKYFMNEKDKVSLIVDFLFGEEDFKISGSYIFVIEVKNLENVGQFDSLEEFIEEEKEKVVFPVYTKISMLISYYSDLVRPFPIIDSPNNWVKDKE